MSITVCGKDTVRAAGTGDFPHGVQLTCPVTFTEVWYRGVTPDGSGNLVVELRKNGAAVAGSSATIAAANQVAGGGATGTYSFAAGDILSGQITGVGTSPGKGPIDRPQRHSVMGCIVTGPRAGFSPTGMKKNGSTFPIPASWGDITGWVVDPAYPGSTLSGDALVASGTKDSATITATVPFSGGTYFGGSGTQVRILVNGTQVGSAGAFVAAGSGTATCTVTTNLVAGDLVKVQIQGSTYNPVPTVTANTPTVSIT
ncbi:hypothetical protein AB0M45_20345 [Nocardia sp. NPDC051787]|uniref:hypothetical protein n=1 Tax=Nocardia sp. NPDC051787 TaxID=3155415 RepID=UPI0034194FBF